MEPRRDVSDGRGLAEAAFAVTWRRHQSEALAAFERTRAAGEHRHYIVLPPGAGKTLVGAEAARRIGRRTLVLAPNTAIVSQWVATWHALRPGVEVGTDRSLDAPVAVLTYQSLAVFDDDDAGEGAGPPRSVVDRLHPNGQKVLDDLASSGPWTVVLDEAHHLIEVWGQVLAELFRRLDHPGAPVDVVALTATPRTRLTAPQAVLVGKLFGGIDYAASTPAVVKTGDLAPFRELALIVPPTDAEQSFIHDEAARFDELRADLVDPSFASTPFLTWCDLRFCDRHGLDGGRETWAALAKREPALTDAALRLVHAGLMQLPDGARLREEHRVELTAADWVELLEDYALRCLEASADERDAKAVEAIRKALPSVGYTLTRRGVRASASPVDRLLSRSAAKLAATVDILTAESANLGPRLRALVVCDFERAAATSSARLSGQRQEPAGSARLALELLASDAGTRDLDPLLVTARTVASRRATASALAKFARERLGDVEIDDVPVGALDDVVEIAGRWGPRDWVPVVTAFFEAGQAQVLVGTRGLLGEGWDARSVNVVVDLTSATTSSSVVQVRGRGLRTDPSWPEKVANTWSVVAVTDEHPKGAADYSRFVAKHEGFFALGPDGVIASGVPHVDPALSPYTPPPMRDLAALNAAARDRAARRDEVHDAWRIGEPYDDIAVRSLRVQVSRDFGVTGRAVTQPLLPGGRARLVTAGVALGGGVAGDIVATATVHAGAGGFLAGAAVGVAGSIAGRQIRDLRQKTSSLSAFADAVAEALTSVGLLPEGTRAVRIDVDSDAQYRARLDGVDEAMSALFADALEEVLSPLASPRYVISRRVRPTPHTTVAVLAAALTPWHGTEVWHAVPATLATNAQRAKAFAEAWRRHVSRGRLLYTGSAEGFGVLEAVRGDDPFAVTTALRTVWR